MIRLYSANHLLEAHALCGRLNNAGISARVLNEYSLGAIGELPASAIGPEIWIEEERDLFLARRLLAEYEQQRDTPGVDRVCPACGEANPAGFEVCWSCRKAF